MSAEANKKRDASPPASLSDGKAQKVAESSQEDVLVELYTVDDTSTSFCVGGSIEKVYLPHNAALVIDGIGTVPLPITEEYVNKIRAVATQAPHGRGTETIVDTSVRNTLQVDASKVSFGGDDDDPWCDLIYDYIGPALGLDRELVQVKPYKFLLYESGGFFAKHRDTEKEDGMFGTLVEQLPSVFKGGKFIVTHNGERKTFCQENTQNFHYISHYADCEHEIQSIESGYRLALVYSLCYTGNGMLPSVNTAHYNALASTIRRLPAKYTKIMCHPLEYQYTIASLSLLGANALKGKDRKKFQVVEGACSANNMQVAITKLRREVFEQGDVVNGRFWADGGPEDPLSYIDKAYRADGSMLTKEEMEPLDKLLERYDFESVDGYGDLLADTETAKSMWGDGETYVEATGNEGATRETFYDAYVLLMFRRPAT